MSSEELFAVEHLDRLLGRLLLEHLDVALLFLSHSLLRVRVSNDYFLDFDLQYFTHCRKLLADLLFGNVEPESFQKEVGGVLLSEHLFVVRVGALELVHEFLLGQVLLDVHERAIFHPLFIHLFDTFLRRSRLLEVNETAPLRVALLVGQDFAVQDLAELDE
jgi:hypothetical protein